VELHEQLQERLEAALGAAPRRRVTVAYSAGGRRSVAGVTSEDEPQVSPGDWTFPTGCLTKLFTGALSNRLVRQGTLRLTDRVAGIFGAAAHLDCLLDTTIEDLLDHTHGLDDAGISQVPLAQNGFIEVGQLLGALSPHRLARPGTIYSYSNAGAWLLAAILERVHGKPYAEQLRDLFGALDATLHLAATSLTPWATSTICPSIGAALAISAADMLRFLESEVLERPQEWPSSPQDGEVKPLAGWNALERGIFRGWKHHGGHWYGHNSLWPGASAVVRVQPRLGAAIVIASTYHPAPLIGGKLFRELLPEYRDASFPRPLAGDALARLDHETYRGRYVSAADSLIVEVRAGQLCLAGSKGEAALVPAADETFFLRPPGRNGLSFVQFVAPENGRFRFLWDGSRVYGCTSRAGL
jgi:CubicO group peptidase (beta-lactamase class C family)